jgi:hypothetical protein
MPVDFIFNGQGSGAVADRLMAANMDVNVLRPWLDKYGRTCVAVYNQRTQKMETKLITNAPAILTRDQWKLFDDAVLRSTRLTLNIWGDIVGAGLTYNIPNGMAYTMIQHQTMTDGGNATLSMDGLRKAERDRPTGDIGLIPLPIVHGDFHFSLREILVSRNGPVPMPLDTTMIEQTTRKCLEQVEMLTLGTSDSYSYGGGTVYGLTNFPQRITANITAPTTAGWGPETLVNETLDLVQQLYDTQFKGPFIAFYSPGWMKYLFADYSAMYGGKTLMSRLGDISPIRAWRQADYLSGMQIVIVQMTPDVIQAITGMRLRTLQWDSHGGLQTNFKIMGIMVPRVRANADDDCGILHATAI